MLEATILDRALELWFQQEVFETGGVDADVAPFGFGSIAFISGFHLLLIFVVEKFFVFLRCEQSSLSSVDQIEGKRYVNVKNV
jgi:hypothetical protein